VLGAQKEGFEKLTGTVETVATQGKLSEERNVIETWLEGLQEAMKDEKQG
jgi:hypothetical protein